jgi:hypothetical protein
MNKVVCDCNKCVAHHPASVPLKALKTVRNHRAIYGVAPAALVPEYIAPVNALRHEPDDAIDDGQTSEELEQENGFDEEDERDEGHEGDECDEDDECDEGTTEDDENEPEGKKRRGRPRRRVTVVNRVALEVILDQVRKHNLTDVCANDLLMCTQAETPLFSHSVKTVAEAERILSRLSIINSVVRCWLAVGSLFLSLFLCASLTTDGNSF